MSEANSAEDPELHISSLVIHFLRDAWPSLQAFIVALPAAELAVTDVGNGKCVVVLERSSLKATEQAMADINQQAGVVAVTLVYHHSESQSALAEPLIADIGNDFSKTLNCVNA